jgi:hypothetical protein
MVVLIIIKVKIINSNNQVLHKYLKNKISNIVSVDVIK